MAKEYIECEGLKDFLKLSCKNEILLKQMYDIIDSCPTEIVEPVIYGKWIPASTKPGVNAGMKCSECKARITYSEHFNGQHLYCHKCGARMLKE